MESFSLAAGSITGRDHRLAGRSNQDGFAILRQSDRLAIVVADGCSSGLHSEVGAKLGARILAQLLLIHANALLRDSKAIERVRLDALAQIRMLANALGGSFSETINDYFLFTSLLALITPDISLFASLGDGFFAINGTMIRLGPFPGNAPPYLSYGLVETALPPANLLFTIQSVLPTNELFSFLLGTDGLQDFCSAETALVPGMDVAVGPLSQFWMDNRFYRNSDQVRRRLAVVNAETRSAYRGLLPDDTTLVVGRRKGGEL